MEIGGYEMADYFAMDRAALTAEKAQLEAEYKKFQDMGLNLNMARGKPGPHQKIGRAHV